MKDMRLYHVVWEIEVSAASPLDAARNALAIQRDPESSATIFDVTEFDNQDADVVRIDVAGMEAGDV